MKFLAATILVIQILVQAASAASVITVEQLRTMPNVTPETLIALFSDFEFRFHAEVQDYNVFLSTRSGDCDDFATLAADVLTRNGYTTHLVAVRMKGETHVVCYVEESHCYLDYNYRKDSKKTVNSDGSLIDIARKVADSFGRDWLATYEFTYQEKIKRLVDKIMTNRTTAAGKAS